MFQYAFGQMLRQDYGVEEIYFDLSYFKEWPHLLNAILSMNVDLPCATEKMLKKICLLKHDQLPHTLGHRIPVFIEWKLNRKYYFERDREYIDPETVLKYDYFDGYWQSWRYLRNIRQKLLHDFSADSLSEQARRDVEFVQSKNCVCMGMRLSDYMANNNHYYIPGANYYIKAMKYMISKLENPMFYVFSDDIERAKMLMAEAGVSSVIYREKEQVLSDHEELEVMKACKHAITPNSTFHWWAAWLKNQSDGILVCPDHWFGDGSKIDIIPPTWIKISESGEIEQ